MPTMAAPNDERMRPTWHTRFPVPRHSDNVHSFEERYPGVWIRHKKKREAAMLRNHSANSMDSWGSDLEVTPTHSSTEDTEKNVPMRWYSMEMEDVTAMLMERPKYAMTNNNMQGDLYPPSATTEGSSTQVYSYPSAMSDDSHHGPQPATPNHHQSSSHPSHVTTPHGSQGHHPSMMQAQPTAQQFNHCQCAGCYQSMHQYPLHHNPYVSPMSCDLCTASPPSMPTQLPPYHIPPLNASASSAVPVNSDSSHTTAPPPNHLAHPTNPAIPYDQVCRPSERQAQRRSQRLSQPMQVSSPPSSVSHSSPSQSPRNSASPEELLARMSISENPGGQSEEARRVADVMGLMRHALAQYPKGMPLCGVQDEALDEPQPAAGLLGDRKLDDKSAVDPRKYKTRLCRNWLETGHCPYEHTCCFAHGPEELRDLTQNHKVLASIGYFSNFILLAMSNGQKPALPPHCLYQQPKVFEAPETVEQLKSVANMLPPGAAFPFQEPLICALKGLKTEPSVTEPKPTDKKKRRRRGGKCVRKHLRGKKTLPADGQQEDASDVESNE